MTLSLTFVSITIGLIFAMLLALMRMSKKKILDSLAWLYIWVIRGTPLFLQILIVYFAVPIMYKDATGGIIIRMPVFTSGVIALSMNTAAYSAEIFRAAIESIDRGQHEAAQALGMNKTQAMLKVIIPQTFKRLVPPLCNEFTVILKDSSLVSAIGAFELVKTAKQFAASGAWKFYFIAGGVYLLLTTLATVIFDKLEKYAGRYE